MQVDDYEPVAVKAPDLSPHEMTVFAPIRVRQRAQDAHDVQRISFEDAVSAWSGVQPEEALTGHVVGEKAHWWANCIVIDFHSESFPQHERDNLVSSAADVVNDLLAHLRWRGRQHYITPIRIETSGSERRVMTPFFVEYLDDQYNALPKDLGYKRWGAIGFNVQTGAITPDVWQQAWQDLTEGVEIPLWEQLFLDVDASEPDSRALVSAFTALESFIREYVDDAAIRLGKNDSVWDWLMTRGDDRDRQPTIAELFDQILYYLEGRSLKTDSPPLWQTFQELKRARNRLVHGERVLDLERGKIIELIGIARQVIDWVRQAQREPDHMKVVLSIEDATTPATDASDIMHLAPDDEPPLEGQD